MAQRHDSIHPTQEQLKLIADLYATGVTYKTISEAVGFEIYSVYYILQKLNEEGAIEFKARHHSHAKKRRM
jgi:hypothetical protein